MPAETPTIDDLRRDIDEIDDAIHDLLLRRTAIAAEIGARKRSEGFAFRPGREAQIVRRLIARHHGPLPATTVVQIWRELIAALTALQCPYSVAVSHAAGQDLRWLARDHYGAGVPITVYESHMGVLRAVADRQATIGVLPLPSGDDADAWWCHLAREGENAPRIVARLPMAAGQGRSDEGEAVVMACAAQEESGKDRSYLILETTHEFSRGTLRSLFTQTGLQVVDVQTWTNDPTRRLHLIEVEGFLPPGDDRLARLTAGEDDSLGSVWSIGSYPVPLSAGELAMAEARTGAAGSGQS